MVRVRLVLNQLQKIWKETHTRRFRVFTLIPFLRLLLTLILSLFLYSLQYPRRICTCSSTPLSFPSVTKKSLNQLEPTHLIWIYQFTASSLHHHHYYHPHHTTTVSQVCCQHHQIHHHTITITKKNSSSTLSLSPNYHHYRQLWSPQPPLPLPSSYHQLASPSPPPWSPPPIPPRTGVHPTLGNWARSGLLDMNFPKSDMTLIHFELSELEIFRP